MNIARRRASLLRPFFSSGRWSAVACQRKVSCRSFSSLATWSVLSYLAFYPIGNVDTRSRLRSSSLLTRFGRQPIMGISFLIMSFAGFLCALAPQEKLGFDMSYTLFTFGRFLLACATRGIALTGFVIGTRSKASISSCSPIRLV